MVATILCAVTLFVLFILHPDERMQNFASQKVIRRNTVASWDVDKSSQPETSDIKCVPAKVKNLTFPICLHESSHDIYISKAFEQKRYFEEWWVSLVLGWLEEDGRNGFIDIGANIGTYTLAAAHLGCKVVAVEPLPRHRLRLHKSLHLGNVSSRVTILQSPISSKREFVRMQVDRINPSVAKVTNASKCTTDEANFCSDIVETIFLDDVVKYVTFNYAVVKFDVEGHEWNALTHSQNFFSKIFVTHIVMEWKWLQIKNDGKNVAEYLASMNYVPYSDRHKLLNISLWDRWPQQIYWKYNI